MEYANVFVFKLLLNSDAEVFCSFPVIKKRRSREELLEESGHSVFVDLRGGYYAIFSVYQNLIKASQTCKIPANVLEFCPSPKGKNTTNIIVNSNGIEFCLSTDLQGQVRTN